jgi:hypothetical protein
VGKATLNFRTRSELGGEKSRIVETKYQIQRIAWQTAILHRHEAPMTGFRLSLLFSGLLCMTLPGQFLAQASLDETLRPFLAKYEMPAVAVAVVQEGKIIALGAVGTRQVGTNTSVTPTDRWHIGSDGKAMTALLAAMLVEEGQAPLDIHTARHLPGTDGEDDTITSQSNAGAVPLPHQWRTC